MCDCNNVNLPTGPAGAQGDPGLFGGWALEWDFDTTLTNGTSATKIRMDNATPASVTNLYINNQNIDSVDSSAFLAAMGSPFGVIKLFKEADSSVFWMGTVTGATSGGTEYTIAVTHTLSNGTFAAGDDIVVSFSPLGATGPTGAAGPAGAKVIELNMTSAAVTSTSYSTPTGGSVAINGTTLDFGDEDDCLVLDAYVYMTSLISGGVDQGHFQITYGSVTLYDSSAFFPMLDNTSDAVNAVRITARIAVTTADTDLQASVDVRRGLGNAAGLYEPNIGLTSGYHQIGSIVTPGTALSGSNTLAIELKATNSKSMTLGWWKLTKELK